MQTSVGEIVGVEVLLRKTLLNPVPGEMSEDLHKYHHYLRKWGQTSEPAKSIRTRTDMLPQRLEEEVYSAPLETENRQLVDMRPAGVNVPVATARGKR